MDYHFLSQTALFQNLSSEEAEAILLCLNSKQQHFQKGNIIYHTGDYVKSIGLVLSGSVTIEFDDIWGNKSLLAQIPAGEIFAETYACLPTEPLLVNVVAADDTDVLFLVADRLLSCCNSACAFHHKLIQNLLLASAQKNLHLSRRIFHTSAKTIRGRLLSYLSYQARLFSSLQFSIPLKRQQLADYLNVDRSALSNELSKMQAEGLLTVKKNHFSLQASCQKFSDN